MPMQRSASRTEKGNKVEQSEPWNQLDIELPQQLPVDFLPFLFTQVGVRIGYFMIELCQWTRLDVFLIVGRWLIAVGIALSDVLLVVGSHDVGR